MKIPLTKEWFQNLFTDNFNVSEFSAIYFDIL